MSEEIKKSIYESIKEGYTEELWYDWFCKDDELENRGNLLLSKMKEIVFSKKIDINKNYMFFKNCSPFRGSLYDELKICDIETRDVLYSIVPRSGFIVDNGEAQVWGKENDFSEPIIAGTWEDVVNFFMKE